MNIEDLSPSVFQRNGKFTRVWSHADIPGDIGPEQDFLCEKNHTELTSKSHVLSPSSLLRQKTFGALWIEE